MKVAQSVPAVETVAFADYIPNLHGRVMQKRPLQTSPNHSRDGLCHIQ